MRAITSRLTGDVHHLLHLGADVTRGLFDKQRVLCFPERRALATPQEENTRLFLSFFPSSAHEELQNFTPAPPCSLFHMDDVKRSSKLAALIPKIRTLFRVEEEEGEEEASLCCITGLNGRARRRRLAATAAGGSRWLT